MTRREFQVRSFLLPAAVLCLSCVSCSMLPDAEPVDVLIGPSAEVAAQSATLPASTQPVEPDESPGPIEVTVSQAILMSLERNEDLNVQRLNPAIRRTYEQEAIAEFDPLLALEGSYARERSHGASSGWGTTGDANLLASLSQRLPTGTDVEAGLSSAHNASTLSNDQYVTRFGLTVNQALLRGAGLDVNLASVRQARLDTLSSQYELRGYAEALVAAVEQAYWNLALAERTIEIVTGSLDLAQKQMDETRERVNVGKLAETELAAAEAEVALRNEDLIDARSSLATSRLTLLRLLNPRRKDLWDRQIVLRSLPTPPEVTLDPVDKYVAVALRMRPELNQARLGAQRGDLEMVKTRNGLLPKLDLFVTLGKSGYAASFARDLRNTAADDGYDALVGLRLEQSIGNRAAQARHSRAEFYRDQTIRAIGNLSQLVQVDVRSAYIEVGRAKAQVTATAATLKLQEETLRAETEKFRVGKSTSLLVAQAQRDLLAAQINQVQAVVAYHRSLINLHLQQGSLLERRGIVAPGATPVELSEKD